jgi:lantibiotic modifying enzyme
MKNIISKYVKDRLRETLSYKSIPNFIEHFFENDLCHKVDIIAIDILKVEEELQSNSFFVNEKDIISVEYLFEEYPAFNLIINELVENYKEFCIEFYCDYLQLNKQHENQLEIDIITFLGSDTHSKSRSVIEVEFKNGEKLVYKPRSSNPEILLYEVFDFFNQKTSLSKFILPSIKQYSNGYFMSYVNSFNSVDKIDLNDYYERIGYLFVISYLLDITDLHSENIIISRQNPIVIDAETIFNAQFYREFIIKEENNKGEKINYFIDKCGLFDFPKVDINNNKDTSGSRLYINNSNLDYNEKFDLIEMGVSKITEVIIENRIEIIDLLKSLGHNELKSRFLLRSTYKYYDLISEINKAKNLMSATKQEDVLNNFFKKSNILNSFILESEKKALLNRDIPLFYIDINTGSLFDDTGILLKKELGKSPKEISIEKIIELSLLTLKLELIYLKNKLKIIDIRKFDKLNINNYTKEYYLSFTDLCLKLEKDMVYFPSVKIDSTGTINVNYENYSLYDGVLGNYLLFQNLLFDNDTLEDYLTHSSDYLLNTLNTDFINDEICRNNLGVFEGISGLLYFLNTSENIEMKKISKNLVDKLYLTLDSNKINPNFFEGCGGILIVLSKYCNDQTEKDRFNTFTNNYIDYVNKNQEAINKPGLAHGISGILLSLLNIGDRNNLVISLINALLEKEDRLFNIDKQNWSDYRYSDENDKYSSSFWCNGSMGIMLVRSLIHKMGIINIYNKPYYKLISNYGINANSSNHLCCGNSGQMACIYEIGVNLGDQKLIAISKKYFSNLSDLPNINFPFLKNNLSNNFSLMTGLTGVLYYYHKVLYNNDMPNILILE